MGKQTQTGKKGSRKIGRASRKPKSLRYKSRDRRTENKLKRVLQSNGVVFAKAWVMEYGGLGYLNKLIAKRSNV